MTTKRVSYLLDTLKQDASKIIVPRQVLDAHYSLVPLVNLPLPHVLIATSKSAQRLVPDLPITLNQQGPSWSLAYGGHQFGHYAGQLGIAIL